MGAGTAPTKMLKAKTKGSTTSAVAIPSEAAVKVNTPALEKRLTKTEKDIASLKGSMDVLSVQSTTGLGMMGLLLQDRGWTQEKIDGAFAIELAKGKLAHNMRNAPNLQPPSVGGCTELERAWESSNSGAGDAMSLGGLPEGQLDRPELKREREELEISLSQESANEEEEALTQAGTQPVSKMRLSKLISYLHSVMTELMPDERRGETVLLPIFRKKNVVIHAISHTQDGVYFVVTEEDWMIGHKAEDSETLEAKKKLKAIYKGRCCGESSTGAVVISKTATKAKDPFKCPKLATNPGASWEVPLQRIFLTREAAESFVAEAVPPRKLARTEGMDVDALDGTRVMASLASNPISTPTPMLTPSPPLAPNGESGPLFNPTPGGSAAPEGCPDANDTPNNGKGKGEGGAGHKGPGEGEESTGGDNLEHSHVLQGQ
jgi:hypothetical protein